MKNENQWEVVHDIKLLRTLIKKKLIIPCDQTFAKITGLYDKQSFKCTYIDSVPKRFEYDGYDFKEQYFDGCFYPHLVRRKQTF